MEKEKPNRQAKSSKEGYIIVPNYFLKKWVRVLGVGPVVLYQELLTYCHKEKTIAWPTIHSLCQEMGIAKTTLLRYQNTLIKFGLIKNITRGKSTTGHYKNNIYQITSLEELSKHPDLGKILDFLGSKMKPDRYQFDTYVGSNMKLSLVSNRYPNNNNLNSTNTTTKEEAVVVDFNKSKEKGEEKIQTTHSRKEYYEKQAPYNSKEHYKGQALRERMREFDLKEGFIEKVLKEYTVNKVEEKLDLLAESKQIRNPIGWLSDALKNDYHNPDMEHSVEDSSSRFGADSGLKEDELKKEARYKTGIIKSRNDKECSANQACKESLIRKRAYHNINQNPIKDIKNQDQDHISRRIALNGVRFVIEELRSLPFTFPPTENMGQDN